MAARSPFSGHPHGAIAPLLLLASLFAVRVGSASPSTDDDPTGVDASPPEPAGEALADLGRPTVKLDQLKLPPGVPYGKFLAQHLKRALARAARTADWGAGAGARIEYRVTVTELKLTLKDGVLRVDCAMLGQLPRGKSAKSRLSYGGSPSQARAVMVQVLEIVARGVVTRLAELERERRSQYW